MSGFGVAKFRSLLLAGSFTVVANYVVRLTTAVLAGNMLGPDALAGVNLVAPVLSAVTFLASLIAKGAGTQYSLALGRCDLTRARQFFMQGLWCVLLFGGLLALVTFFAKEVYLGLMGATSNASGFACAYLAGFWPVAVLEGVLALMVSLGYADGDTRLCAISYAVVFVVNAVVSYVCVKAGLGLYGCALGTVAADTAGILVLALHFGRRGNSFRIVRHFAWRDGLTIANSALGDAASFLLDGLLVLLLNAFVIRRFGSEWLPVAGVVTVLWGFLTLFEGIGVALQPIVTVYGAERNTRAIRAVMGAAMRVTLVEGIVLAGIALFAPELVVRLVGLDDPQLAPAAVRAVRLVGIAFVPLAFAGIFNSYYMYVERPLLAGALTLSGYLFVLAALIAGGFLLGIDGVWIGFGLGPYLGVATIALVIVCRYGVRYLPLMLPRDRERKLTIFDLFLTERDIAYTSACVSETLASAGIPDSVRVRASLMVEEVFMVVRDRNRNRIVRGEVTLDLNDGVRMTLRDDGEIFDITDADAQISSLRTYLVASMMEHQAGRLNLTTTGFNRNVFRF